MQGRENELWRLFRRRTYPGGFTLKKPKRDLFQKTQPQLLVGRGVCVQRFVGNSQLIGMLLIEAISRRSSSNNDNQTRTPGRPGGQIPAQNIGLK